MIAAALQFGEAGLPIIEGRRNPTELWQRYRATGPGASVPERKYIFRSGWVQPG